MSAFSDCRFRTGNGIARLCDDASSCFNKYRARCVAEGQYRVNRRFELSSLVNRLLWGFAGTMPCPESWSYARLVLGGRGMTLATCRGGAVAGNMYCPLVKFLPYFGLWLVSMSNAEAPESRSWFAVQIGYAVNSEQFRKALLDIWNGWKQRTLWTTIGLHDVRQRYRRSVLGPFWITISMGIMIGALGVLYSQIFKIDLTEYLPYLAAGLFAWGLISNLVIEGCLAFNSGEHLIKQLSAPLSIHVYRVLWSNLLTAAHNVWIYVAVALWFKVDVGWSLLLIIPALALILANGLWVGLLLGLLSARFRDIPMTVSSVVQVMFFLTPIIWKPDMLPGRTFFLDANPFYHFVEILRDPMLGQVPTIENWAATVLITVIGWIIALAFYTAYRWRLAYWV